MLWAAQNAIIFCKKKTFDFWIKQKNRTFWRSPKLVSTAQKTRAMRINRWGRCLRVHGLGMFSVVKRLLHFPSKQVCSRSRRAIRSCKTQVVIDFSPFARANHQLTGRWLRRRRMQKAAAAGKWALAPCGPGFGLWQLLHVIVHWCPLEGCLRDWTWTGRRSEKHKGISKVCV